MNPTRLALLIALIAVPASTQAADVGAWSFDEGEGDVTSSSTNDKHPGSITGATWSEGKSGKALVFKGPDYSEPYRPPGTFVVIKGSEGLNPSKRVTVSASITAERAVFTIADQGDGFDARKFPDPTDTASLLAPSGRGLALASAFLDEVRFNDRGNEVTLVKHRSPKSDG